MIEHFVKCHSLNCLLSAELFKLCTCLRFISANVNQKFASSPSVESPEIRKDHLFFVPPFKKKKKSVYTHSSGKPSCHCVTSSNLAKTPLARRPFLSLNQHFVPQHACGRCRRTVFLFFFFSPFYYFSFRRWGLQTGC